MIARPVRTPRLASDARVSELLAQPQGDRDMLCDAPVRLRRRGQHVSLSLHLRLPSYRSLPLSCIEAIQLTIDDRPVATSAAELEFEGVTHPLRELGSRPNVWWYILDEAILHIPLDAPIALGRHRVQLELTRVEPYITAGRFSFTTRSTRELSFNGEGIDE